MKVLIADKFADTGIEALRGLGCDVDCNPDLKGDALTQAVKDANCQVLIVRSTKVDRAALEAGENLKLIIRAGSGFDTIDFEGAAELDIRVCNCPGMNSVAVAELTIGLMVALDRRIVDETVDLRRGVWNKKEYGKSLEANLEDLAHRIQNGRYRPQPKREVLIPKANGKTRPIAIACFEDKLVDWVVGKILTEVFEPLFIRNSFGYRPEKSADDVVKACYHSLEKDRRPYVTEIDFSSFFNTKCYLQWSR